MWDAIVLAGGTARRLGGVDKPALQIDGRSLLDHVLTAVSGAGRRVVVGPRRATPHDVVWTREEPAGGGPVAAIAAGLPLTRAPVVVLLAADLPWIAGAVPVLVTAASPAGVGAAMLVDPGGRPNHLAAAWRRDALIEALAAIGDPAGAAVRSLVAAASWVGVPDVTGWGRDCDTWDDLAQARERHPGTPFDPKRGRTP